MMSIRLSETAERAIAAYGGRTRWQNATYVQAEVSVSGLAFRLKRRPFLSHATIVVDAHRPFSRLTPIGRAPGTAGVLDGQDVRLENSRGEVIAGRKNAREYFTPGRRTFCWDDLDMAYFANYAFWNYLTLPALLMRDDIDWSEPEPGRMEARFPEWIPTHCCVQQFRFDRPTGRLIQHDYTAEIISRYAHAAHVTLEHDENNRGVVYPSARRVTPRGPRENPFSRPVLIHIDVHDFQLNDKSAPAGHGQKADIRRR